MATELLDFIFVLATPFRQLRSCVCHFRPVSVDSNYKSLC